ncbi:MAG: hypothetical protein IPL01_18335 [Acidobacteria bacterium]|nr:hypothetical protein [Acidobacteriota bacterium]
MSVITLGEVISEVRAPACIEICGQKSDLTGCVTAAAKAIIEFNAVVDVNLFIGDADAFMKPDIPVSVADPPFPDAVFKSKPAFDSDSG